MEGEPEDDEYEVENIVDFRFVKGRPKFLVKWKGFPADDNTWEPEENMTNLPAFTEKMATMKQAYFAAKNAKRKTDSKPVKDGKPATEAVVSVDAKSDEKRKLDEIELVQERKEKVHKPTQGAEQEEAVEVEDLLDYKPRFKKDYFLVRWKGDWEDSWEPRRNLLIVGDLMNKMVELKMSYLRIYGPAEMEEDVFVIVQSIRISGTATLSAVVVEMTKDSESRSLMPLQDVRQKWPQQLLDFLLSRLRLRATPEGETSNKIATTQLMPLQ